MFAELLVIASGVKLTPMSAALHKTNFFLEVKSAGDINMLRRGEKSSGVMSERVYVSMAFHW